jgi:tetratricopeptide (TPR) repeat protein
MAHFKAALALEAPGVDTAVVERLVHQNESGPGGETNGEESGPDLKEARSLFEEATALLEAGEAEMALSLLKRYLAVLPEDPFAHHQAGLALDLLNREKEAEQELKTALELGRTLKVKLPATYLKLAELAIKDSRYSDAEKYLDEHDQRFPDQASNMIAVSLRRVLQLREP